MWRGAVHPGGGCQGPWRRSPEVVPVLTGAPELGPGPGCTGLCTENGWEEREEQPGRPSGSSSWMSVDQLLLSGFGTSWFPTEPLANVTLGAKGHWVKVCSWAAGLVSGEGTNGLGRRRKGEGRGQARKISDQRVQAHFPGRDP